MQLMTFCGLKNQKMTELKISHESLENLCYGVDYCSNSNFVSKELNKSWSEYVDWLLIKSLHYKKALIKLTFLSMNNAE